MIWQHKESRKKKQNNPKFDEFIKKVDVEHFGFNNLLQDLNNIFNNLKVLKKVIQTETFNDDFHNKFIKFGLFCFFYFIYIYIYIYADISQANFIKSYASHFTNWQSLSSLFYNEHIQSKMLALIPDHWQYLSNWFQYISIVKLLARHLYCTYDSTISLVMLVSIPDHWQYLSSWFQWLSIVKLLAIHLHHTYSIINADINTWPLTIPFFLISMTFYSKIISNTSTSYIFYN